VTNVVGKSLREQLGAKLGRGTIYHHYSDIAGKGKYIILLNHGWPPTDGLVVYAHCTSQLTHFKGRALFEAMIVRLPQGAYDFCKAEETVIDLANIVERPLAEVLDSRQFQYIGELSREHISAIDAAVRTSTVVSARMKKRILGG